MRRFAALVLVVAVLVLAGCGGQLGSNSPVQIRLESNGSTVAFGSLNLIVSPNSGAFNAATAVSNTQGQAWATVTGNAAFTEIDFVTVSQRIPYYVWVQNTSGVAESARFRVFVEGDERIDTTVNVPANSQVRIATVFRNNVQQVP